MSISVEEAQSIIDKYFEAVPKLIEYLNKCADYGMAHGYIRSYKPYSFVRYLPGWYPGLSKDTDEYLYERLRRICFNTPIQASGAFMTKKALVEINKYIVKNNLQHAVKIIMAVHDQIDIEVKEDFAEEWSRIQKSIMETVGTSLVKNVSILSEITISDCWTK